VYQDAFLTLQNEIKNKEYKPRIYSTPKEEFHVLAMTSLQGEYEAFTSPSKMLDTYFSGKAERDRVQQQARDLSRFIKNELNKNKRKLKKHEQTIKSAQKAKAFQKRGELLTA